MRIIGYIDTKGYKTTVFKNNERFIVKFEADMLEQTYKFEASEQLQGLNDVQLLVDAAFQRNVTQRFKEMYEFRKSLLHQHNTIQEEDEWDEII
jgi:hypothetical protein